MHISEESEEEADAERKEANELEAHEAPEKDEKQEDAGNVENPEHSNEEQNCCVWETPDLDRTDFSFWSFYIYWLMNVGTWIFYNE